MSTEELAVIKSRAGDLMSTLIRHLDVDDRKGVAAVLETSQLLDTLITEIERREKVK